MCGATAFHAVCDNFPATSVFSYPGCRRAISSFLGFGGKLYMLDVDLNRPMSCEALHAIGELWTLEEICLRGVFERIPRGSWSNLRCLLSIELAVEGLKEIAREIFFLPLLERVVIRKRDSLCSPPSALFKNVGAMDNVLEVCRTYFSCRLVRFEALRVAIIGHEHSGKTALVNSMFHGVACPVGAPSEDIAQETEGIEAAVVRRRLGEAEHTGDCARADICAHPAHFEGITYPDMCQRVGPLLGDSELHVWDFAGQAHYMSSHRWFFTAESLCIVVYRAHDPVGQTRLQLQRWVESMEPCPFLLVATHLDMVRDSTLWEADWKELYTWLCRLMLGASRWNGSAGTEDALVTALKRYVDEPLGVTNTCPASTSEVLRRVLKVKDTPPCLFRHVHWERPAQWVRVLRDVQERSETECLLWVQRQADWEGEALRLWHDAGLIMWFDQDEMLQNIVFASPGEIARLLSVLPAVAHRPAAKLQILNSLGVDGEAAEQFRYNIEEGTLEGADFDCMLRLVRRDGAAGCAAAKLSVDQLRSLLLRTHTILPRETGRYWVPGLLRPMEIIHDEQPVAIVTLQQPHLTRWRVQDCVVRVLGALTRPLEDGAQLEASSNGVCIRMMCGDVRLRVDADGQALQAWGTDARTPALRNASLAVLGFALEGLGESAPRQALNGRLSVYAYHGDQCRVEARLNPLHDSDDVGTRLLQQRQLTTLPPPCGLPCRKCLLEKQRQCAVDAAHMAMRNPLEMLRASIRDSPAAMQSQESGSSSGSAVSNAEAGVGRERGMSLADFISRREATIMDVLETVRNVANDWREIHRHAEAALLVEDPLTEVRLVPHLSRQVLDNSGLVPLSERPKEDLRAVQGRGHGEAVRARLLHWCCGKLVEDVVNRLPQRLTPGPWVRMCADDLQRRLKRAGEDPGAAQDAMFGSLEAFGHQSAFSALFSDNLHPLFWDDNRKRVFIVNCVEDVRPTLTAATLCGDDEFACLPKTATVSSRVPLRIVSECLFRMYPRSSPEDVARELARGAFSAAPSAELHLKDIGNRQQTLEAAARALRELGDEETAQQVESIGHSRENANKLVPVVTKLYSQFRTSPYAGDPRTSAWLASLGLAELVLGRKVGNLNQCYGVVRPLLHPGIPKPLRKRSSENAIRFSHWMGRAVLALAVANGVKPNGNAIDLAPLFRQNRNELDELFVCAARCLELPRLCLGLLVLVRNLASHPREGRPSFRQVLGHLESIVGVGVDLVMRADEWLGESDESRCRILEQHERGPADGHDGDTNQ